MGLLDTAAGLEVGNKRLWIGIGTTLSVHNCDTGNGRAECPFPTDNRRTSMTFPRLVTTAGAVQVSKFMLHLAFLPERNRRWRAHPYDSNYFMPDL